MRFKGYVFEPGHGHWHSDKTFHVGFDQVIALAEIQRQASSVFDQHLLYFLIHFQTSLRIHFLTGRFQPGIDLRVAVPADIVSAFAVEQQVQKVVGIGVIGQPAYIEQLILFLFDDVWIALRIDLTYCHFYSQIFPPHVNQGFGQHGNIASPRCGVSYRGKVINAPVAGLTDQFFRFLRVEIQPFDFLVIAGHCWRQYTFGLLNRIFKQNLDYFLFVYGVAEGLTDFRIIERWFGGVESDITQTEFGGDDQFIVERIGRIKDPLYVCSGYPCNIDFSLFVHAHWHSAPQPENDALHFWQFLTIIFVSLQNQELVFFPGVDFEWAGAVGIMPPVLAGNHVFLVQHEACGIKQLGKEMRLRGIDGDPESMGIYNFYPADFLSLPGQLVIYPDDVIEITARHLRAGFRIAGAFNGVFEIASSYLVSGHIDILTTSYNPSVQGKELLLAIKTAAMNLQIAQENADASVDTAEINLSIAKRTLESASAQILQKEADTASARANLARARDELAHVQDGLNLELPRMAFDKARLAFEEAQDQLADAALTAPFDGIVAAVNIDAGDQIMASTVVMQMVDTGKVEIAAAVDEIDVAKMKIGQQAEIYVDAFRDIALPGEVTAISPMGRNQSGLITYDLTISIKDSKGYPLKDLMTVTVDIEAVLASDVLLVPNAAIHKDRATGSKTVTVLADSGEEEVRVVWTGVSDGKLTEITSGLKEGERIVSSVDIEVTESSIEAPGADVDIMECITNMQELMPCFEKLMGMADELGIDTSTYSGGEIDWDEIEYWANNDTGEVPDDVQECLQKLLENRDCLDALIRMAEDMGIDTRNFSLDNMGGMMGN